METLGERIARLRKADGKRQEDLALALKGYDIKADRGTVARWETNKQEPMMGPIMALSKIFGVTAEYLVNGLSDDIIIKPNERDIIETVRLRPKMVTLYKYLVVLSDDQLDAVCSLIRSLYPNVKSTSAG